MSNQQGSNQQGNKTSGDGSGERAANRPGRVYLVGAGPGDPELLTLKGRRVLGAADVVVYDRLANESLLQFVPAGAERVYVGKEAQRHAMPQEEINRLLVERARAGRLVCRLKGGDPFLFGRGGEEAEALAAAGIEWEYVPGITSAIGAPGYAGIPVTHRGLCATLAVVTAHEDPHKGGETVRWEHVAAGADTIVLLMGAERLEQSVSRLLEHGRPPDTPAAVVSWGTYARQRTVTGTLADIVARCREAGCGAPAVTVIGEVAALRERLRWFDNRPLFGRRVVVTRPRDQAGDLVSRLAAAGAEPVLCPTIRVQPLPEPALDLLEQRYDWAVFTSVNGVAFLAAALRRRGWDLRRLGLARIAAIGPETARAAADAGLYVDLVPRRYVAEGILEGFPEPVAGRRVLLTRAREARDLLPRELRARGAEVDVLPVYESVPDREGAEAARPALEAGEFDVITFTASSTVRQFRELFPEVSLERAVVACIGPITAATARELGIRVDVTAAEHTVPGLMRGLEGWFTPV